MNATTPVESGSGSAPASQEDLAQLRAEMAQMREEAKRMRDEAEQMKAEIAQDRIAMSDQLSVLDDRGGQWSDYLEIQGLHVEFDGFVAVDNLNLTVEHGDLRFLIGPNGAGKTTIIDAITGLVSASGSATFRGEQLLGKKPNDIVKLGVGRTFQTASVVEELSVVENLQLAEGFRRKGRGLFRTTGAASQNVTYMMDVCSLTDDADKRAGILPHGKKQWLEIGMLLVQDAHLLLLDEPVAGMTPAERLQTGELLKRCSKNRTVIIVEHDMDFMRQFADSVTVLNQGTVLAEGSVEDIQNNEEVVRIYLGGGE
ncbi:MAG: urea ABC transporter ATP-binding protein UrtD [Bifidobacterium tibiigranuli]|jgi:urea transport system ATP-binding protein|uniref:urea ABC transporter ATP-binding protein UrtD n=1 Tax=Bifidobacterium tibiigranuli TaxID=2172043 RepID=UPI002353D040|nr:urea ABC transporter ATP-binding protein UrtD [Bifidobacterium tibiigranuli]MCH3974679.1 urea ABC transporter ATP-binding protein UrtD [Bifidobacterium tibiigranuli]MCH4203647.1 urea ABC transporter ATP-binding protein UrtD [Bifidobacterium tibiigranuli]MCH4274146.1 urea ABC transporter ATP-binding protein UrtD [Bifidobacterium tibiigranuli]MCI1790914.1 urea ABC transporter ATP-binding protein UrtD [Bifidobacterium tibiigranuli]MCI1797848.1 urea ABC transporter ATP-binding protein UrtD [Bif